MNARGLLSDFVAVWDSMYATALGHGCVRNWMQTVFVRCRTREIWKATCHAATAWDSVLGYKAKHWYQRFAKHWMTPWRAAFFWRAMTWWHAKSYLPKFGYRFSYSVWSCLICLAILPESLRPWCVTTTTCWGTIDTQTYTIRIGQLISMPWPLRVKYINVQE